MREDSREEDSGREPPRGDERGLWKQQPPGGPGSDVQSAPLDACGDSLSLQSKAPQPLQQKRTDELLCTFSNLAAFVTG